MLKCAREQKADKCRNTEPGVRVRERRPSWLKDDEQEVKRLGRIHSWTKRNLNLVSVTKISLDTMYSK